MLSAIAQMIRPEVQDPQVGGVVFLVCVGPYRRFTCSRYAYAAYTMSKVHTQSNMTVGLCWWRILNSFEQTVQRVATRNLDAARKIVVLFFFWVVCLPSTRTKGPIPRTSPTNQLRVTCLIKVWL